MRVVYIEWIDSGESDCGWEPTPGDSADAIVPCESIGFVARETDDHIWISTTADTVNGNWLSAVRIWKPSVRTCRDVVWLEG